MADRRCFSKKVVESDGFWKLSAGAQALYLHLCMAADDDGFINCAGVVSSRFPGGTSHLKKLVEDGFLLKFGGIYVVRHWKVSNSLQNDRKKPLGFPVEAGQIYLKKNREYTTDPSPGDLSLLERRNGSVLESRMESKMESQPNRTEENRKEENQTEGNRIRGNPPGMDRAEGSMGMFQRLYFSYPDGKRGVLEFAYQTFSAVITSKEQLDKALYNLEFWKNSSQWKKSRGQYIPYLSNWLERGLWAVRPEGEVLYGATGRLGEAELEAIKKILEEENGVQDAIYPGEQSL